MTDRKYYIDLLRVIAILSVVLMHCTGFYDDKILPNDIGWITSIILGSLTRFAVPVFVMISGSLLLIKEELIIKELFQKNILRFVTSYLFWSLIYTIVFSFIPYYGSISLLAIKNIVSGTLKGGYFHFWYMPMITGLYVLAPIIKGMIDGNDRKRLLYWCVISFMVCFVVPILSLHSEFNNIFGELIETFSVGFYDPYLLYFTLFLVIS